MRSCYKDLVITDLQANDYKEAILKVGELLYKGGYVKETYIEEVIKREKVYPTGLILEDMNIAMPHTTGDHVIVPAVCIAKLSNPVIFKHMGDPDTEVKAELIFMMAIKNPDDQVETLKNVMSVFTNKEAVEEFKSAQDKEALFSVAMKYIG